MTIDRKALLALLALDFGLTILVFNVVSHYWGISDHLIFGPLLGPILALAVGIYLIDGYRVRTDMISLDYTSLHAIAVASAMLGTLLFTFAFIPEGYELQASRGVIAVSFALLGPLTLAYRRMFYYQLIAVRERRSLVFLGDRPSCEKFAEECAKMGTGEPLIFALPDGATDAAPPLGGARLRPFSEVLDDIQQGRIAVAAIVLREASGGVRPDIAEHLVRLHFSGVPTYTLELFHQIYWRKIPIYRLNPTWLFQEGFPIAREPVFERLKRASDVLFSAAGLVLAVPVLAAAAAAIWIEDRGPVFFVQSRVGRNHVRFRAIKLRTMRPGGPEGALYTQPRDARITRVGRFLRMTRLDELPQLWNVLRGDMSLIGPRAEWDRLVDEYERQIPCYNFRHLVKPGITGWAQVNYLYGASLEDTVRKLEYDLYYIRHFSFTLDASIILKTIQVMLFGKGR